MWEMEGRSGEYDGGIEIRCAVVPFAGYQLKQLDAVDTMSQ